MALIMWIGKIHARLTGAVPGERDWGARNEWLGILVVALAVALPLAPRLAWARDQSVAPPQVRSQAPTATQSETPQASQDTTIQADGNCPGHPDALGTSRVVQLDPAQYRRVGRMQYPDALPLNDKEVVLTFDDGPLPPYSNEILDTLASRCVKVTYFMVGEMARAYPAVVRRAYEEGHTIGTHSEDHPLRFGQLPVEKMRHEIDWGISDVSAALGDPKYLAPFFRIPGLARSDLVESELAARGLIVFSSDTVADDWHRHIKPDQITALAMRRLEGQGHFAPARHPCGDGGGTARTSPATQGQRLPHRAGGPGGVL
jgi:hypothetical protein